MKESVGIACGLFIVVIHTMGLATLPHTPSPMRFLNSILDQPGNEGSHVLFPVGFPAADATVPDPRRKPLADVLVWHGQAKAADVPAQIPGCGGEATAAP